MQRPSESADRREGGGDFSQQTEEEESLFAKYEVHILHKNS
jgi:hypothetical protein